MRIPIALVAVAGVAVIAPIYSTLRAEQATTRSVLDGVYSEEQAKRGEEVYGHSCASCHGPALMGTDMAPPLTGDAFMANWKDAPVSDIAEKIRLAMPSDDPGTLDQQQTADVVSYILSVSKYPAGQTELGTDVEVQKQIRIDPPKP